MLFPGKMSPMQFLIEWNGAEGQPMGPGRYPSQESCSMRPDSSWLSPRDCSYLRSCISQGLFQSWLEVGRGERVDSELDNVQNCEWTRSTNRNAVGEVSVSCCGAGYQSVPLSSCLSCTWCSTSPECEYWPVAKPLYFILNLPFLKLWLLRMND